MLTEAIIAIVAKMRDEASPKMEKLGTTTKTANLNMRDLKLSLVAIGSAFTSIGSLVNRIDNPLAKMGADFLLTAGAIFSTAGAIITIIPVIKSLITWLRSLALVQTLVKALSGPAGWAQLAAGLAIGAAAYAGTSALMNSAGGGGTVNRPANVTIQTAAFMGNDSDARKFSRKMQTISREDTRLGR